VTLVHFLGGDDVCAYMVPSCRLRKNVRRLESLMQSALFIGCHAVLLELLFALLQTMMLQSTVKLQGI
jgi:hypothetical protein